jgi:polyferredoxin
MYVEIVLASICTFVWWFSEPGLINHICLSVMFISSVSTVLFNGNPLLRFDGYYILSDLLDIPNLYNEGQQYVRSVIARIFLGTRSPRSRTLRAHPILVRIYGWAAFQWRMLVFLGIFLEENVQIEGFFLYLLGGIFSGAVIHYLVAKLAGPVIFSRGWCGWSCWTAMILDLLPYKRNKSGRLPRKWEYLRQVVFVLSLGTVLVLWYGFGHRTNSPVFAPLAWLLVGNLVYYSIGIALAFTLRDNRAFCKYVCPIPVLQKFPSRFSMLKVEGAAEKCTGCEACDKMCPMDIQISQYTQSHQRVLSTECILCNECVDVCAHDALKISFGFDFGNRELLNRKDSSQR